MSAQCGETLKIRIFYVVFLTASGVGFWLANSDGAIPFASAMANSQTLSSSAPIGSQGVENQPPMPTLRTVQQLDMVLSCGCSVIFVEADWSFNTACARRIAVYPLIRAWDVLGGAKQVSFYRVDATDRNPVVDALLARTRGRIQIIPDAALVIVTDGPIVDSIQWSGERSDGLFRRLHALTRTACSEVVK